ncbi:ROK family transcriptional regulator [Actinokineospora auranticolor]|uniref:Putative NBD/HSP70 family sugar kinase n=1 Tax=Actinokineospora auranticolor TaxID=155976 RepID=A0A2S6GIJ5_9PSEU|nr:ROK family transcriptional regulator [Actinokineospora auranticolor]PPK65035.1 putative NBD/HSP70 family sugar kinase [Actinokineospora auranticolor]
MSAISVPGEDRFASSTAMMLRAVLRHGPLSRRALGRLVGMSGSTMTRHSAVLLDTGLIRETEGRPDGRVGRPHVPLAVNPRACEVIGVHLAHEFGTVAVADLCGRIIRQRRVEYRGDSPGAAVDSVAAVAARWVEPGRTRAVGVATGGWVDADQGVLVSHPSLGWRSVPVRDIVANRVRLPVHVDNHTRGLVQAEGLFGDVDPEQSVLFLFVGNVVDAAVRTGREVHRGPRSGAGVVAHLPVGDPAIPCPDGHTGCFEATVADQAWARRVSGASFWDLLGKAQGGDARARELFVARGGIVGRAAALLYDIVNPDVLIVAELGASAIPECLDAIRAEVGRRSLLCSSPTTSIRASAFPPAEILAVSAAGVALAEVYADPIGAVRTSHFMGRS